MHLDPEQPVTLEGDHVRLEPLAISHHPRLSEIGLDTTLWESTVVRVQTADQMLQYIKDALTDHEAGLALPFVIIEKTSNQIVGTTRFHSINKRHKRLEIGFTWIALQWQRTLINTETKLLLLQQAFEVYECVRVQFKATVENENSRRALLRIGAKEEGILRNYVVSLQDQARNVRMFSITVEEWPVVRDSIKTRLNQETGIARSDYDKVAAAYAEALKDELGAKPFDRLMLDWLIEKSPDHQVICDMGCGPGQVASYLRNRGASVHGIDLSPAMIEEAIAISPDISFDVGDMLNLHKVADNSFGGIAAFYSIVHFSRSLLTRAFSELFRVLMPGGSILVTHHIGSEVVHRDELFGVDVDMDFYFFQADDVKEQLVSAGFTLEEVLERDPYPGVEFASRRSYIFARKGEEGLPQKSAQGFIAPKARALKPGQA